MNKKIIWKAVLITALIVVAVWRIYPPYKTLKPGTDLAGGTSLIYDIDTTGLSGQEQQGLAGRMIPILLKRIDPTKVANIVMRPQGSSRIEIQLPISSVDTKEKRQAYEKALEELDKKNINLIIVKRSLGHEPQKRQEDFEGFASGSAQRRAILDELASVYDKRNTKQQERDKAQQRKKDFAAKIDAAGVQSNTVELRALSWSKLDEAARAREIEKFVTTVKPQPPQDPSKPQAAPLTEEQKKAVSAITDYIRAYSEWAKTVNELAEPQTGVGAQWDAAVKKLAELNLSVEQMIDVLELPLKSNQRKTALEGFRTKFADRKDNIDAVITAYEKYEGVRGRLDDPEDLKRMLRGSGVLEFRILPTTADGKSNPSELEGYKEALRTKGPKLASDSRYVWCETEKQDQFKHAYRQAGEAVTGTFGEKTYVLASSQARETMLHGGQKAWRLRRAYPTYDEMGRRAVGFTFDPVAGALFYSITSSNVSRPLCILLDNKAISAPEINEAIRGSGIIRGEFTQTEVDDMVNKLNAGSFPAMLSEVPISEKSIGSTIGADNLRKGINAAIISLIAVTGFMMIYYAIAGAIADAALLLNLLFTLAIMAMLRATFTLPGIGGLILTIGMSVDANVLIFERIREEQKRGSSLRTAIANGYHRAFGTIFDSNVTTILTALILYLVASEEIKGFAIVLMLGIATSMFTALFVTRTVFDFLTSRKILTNHLPMMRLIGIPNINWIGLRKYFIPMSLIVITAGIVVFFSRSDVTNNKYDIEFTGGTSVQIDLKDDLSHTRSFVEETIRQKGEAIGNSALANSKVYQVGQTGYQYEITTTATNKTTATLTFGQAVSETPQSIVSAIHKTTRNMARTMENLQADTKDNKVFTISTSQVNKAFVKEVLEKAFAGKAAVSEPEVNEIVSQAVREAFEGRLVVRESLSARVSRMEKVSDSDVELSDFFGGAKFYCTLEQETTADDVERRIKDIRFKADFQDVAWYRYKILSDNLVELKPEDKIKSFVFISVHPEAGYRELSEEEWTRYLENEQKRTVSTCNFKTTLARVTQIDPSVGNEAKNRALLATILSFLAIIGYVWVRFGTARYGFAAVIALVHDVLVSVGAVVSATYIAGTVFGNALLIGDFKINMDIIAAFLTIIGFSINDTIVIFDRIRENRGKLATLTPELVNNSINQTMSRTILTSFTTFTVVVIMYIWGGGGLRGFNFAMIIGLVSGTYSTVAIAAPILIKGTKKASAAKAG